MEKRYFIQAFKVVKGVREGSRLYVMGFTNNRKILLHKENERWLSISITPSLLPGEDDYPDWQALPEDNFNHFVFEAMEQTLPGWIKPISLTIIKEAAKSPGANEKTCPICLCKFPAKTNATFCSGRCRVAAHRSKAKLTAATSPANDAITPAVPG